MYCPDCDLSGDSHISLMIAYRCHRDFCGAKAGQKRGESGTKAGRNWDESRAKVGGLSGALTGLVSIRLSPALLCPGQAHDEGNIKRREDEGQKRKIRENKNSVTRHPPIRPTLAGLQQLDYSVRHSSIAFSQGV